MNWFSVSLAMSSPRLFIVDSEMRLMRSLSPRSTISPILRSFIMPSILSSTWDILVPVASSVHSGSRYTPTTFPFSVTI